MKDRPILLPWAPLWETQPHLKPLAEEIAALYDRTEGAEERLLEISVNSTRTLLSLFPRAPQADENPGVE